jgi:hypothetical protein
VTFNPQGLSKNNTPSELHAAFFIAALSLFYPSALPSTDLKKITFMLFSCLHVLPDQHWPDPYA